MENTNKPGNLLEAVKKYSEEERQQILSRTKSLKAEELRKAEVRGNADADKYIAAQLSVIKSEITSEYSVKNFKSKGKLFKKRDAMLNEIFDRAEKKLSDFTSTEEYKAKLLSDAKEIAEAFKDNGCVIYLSRKDLKFADEVKSVFNSSVEIKEDLKIRIGGVRGFCESLKLVADNTLDSKLEAQKEWFTENANLRIN